MLYFTQFLLTIVGSGSAGWAGMYLFGDGISGRVDVSAIIPNYILLVMFVLGILMALTAILGACGTYHASRDLKANNDGRLTEDDFYVGKIGRKRLNLFIFTLFMYFLISGAIAYVSVKSSMQLEEDADNANENRAAKELVSSFSKRALNSFYEKYSAAEDGFEDEQWVATQDYFDCCGYDRAHHELMTGAACTFPYPDADNPQTVWTKPDGEKCEAGQTAGCTEFKKGALKPASKTCSDHFADMFQIAGIISCIMVFILALSLLASCCLLCGARTGEDVPDDFSSGGGGHARGLQMGGIGGGRRNY